MAPKINKKNVYYLGIVSLLTDISSEMIFPILPIFLSNVLNVNIALIGLIEGIAESISSFLKYISGWLSDKLKRSKSLVLMGYCLSTFSKPFLAIASSWWHVLLVRVCDRIGKGIRTTPRDVLIANSIGRSERGKYFGIHRAMDSFGAIIGVLITFIILFKVSNLAGKMRLIFWISFVPGIIAVIFLAAKVKETTHKQKNHKIKLSLNFKNLPKELKKFLLIITLFSLGNFSYAFFILKANDLEFNIALIPLVYLVYNIFYAALSYPSGKIADKLGGRTVLSFGYFIFALTSIGFAFFATQKSIWFLFAIYGIFVGITDGVSRALVSNLSRKNEQGKSLGVYHTLIGISILPANFLGGLLWHNISSFAPFLFSAIIAIISGFLILKIKDKPTIKTPRA